MNVNEKIKLNRKKNIVDIVLLVGVILLTILVLKIMRGTIPLLDQLISDDDQVRQEAIEEFKTKDRQLKEKYVCSLIAILNDEHHPSRYLAVNSLGEMGPLAIVALPDLRRALHSDSYDVRWNIFHAIADLGLAAQQAAPDLIPFLNAQNKYERASAAIALVAVEEIDGHREKIIEELILALHYNDEFTRKRAITMLGMIGSKAKRVIPLLLEIAKDSEHPHRRYALWALGRMGETNEDIFNVLVKALEDADSNIWLNAMISLELLYPEAKNSVPLIKEQLNHQKAHDRFSGALLFAAYEGDAIDTRVLIDLGADVNIKGFYTGKTPLMIAAENGRIETVKVLLNNGANIKAVSDGKAVSSKVIEPFFCGRRSFWEEIGFVNKNNQKYENKTALEYVKDTEILDELKQEIINLLNNSNSKE